MVTCLSCGGTFEPVQADGMQYFHRCPPLSAPELQAAVDAGAVTLPKGETVEEAVARRVYERANCRDENLPSTHEKHAGVAKLEGDGVAELPDAAPTVIVVTMPPTAVAPVPVPLPPAPDPVVG